MLRIGLVMLQGARHAHLHALNEAAKDLQIEVEIFELRNKNDLLQCNPQAIVLPGGESTTMRYLRLLTNAATTASSLHQPLSL